MRWAERQILSPLTKGGNLPFRRLCVDFGAEVTVSEMAYARQLVRGSRSEMALLRHHGSEQDFGVQIASRTAEEAVAAGRIAVERGAKFVDLNCGCPIHDVVRRGMGAALLKREQALGRVVEAMVKELDVPVTVKIRSGWKQDKVNASTVARLVEEAGAAALTVHARTREQRYSRVADWDLVSQIVSERSIPIIGNGDVLTHFEARDRLQHSGCAAVMIARGALIKPWIFRELKASATWEPDAEERLRIYHRLAGYMREHFYDDDRGRKRAMTFLPWHFSFFWRYRPLPEGRYLERSREHPLMQTRIDDDGDADQAPLERLLRDPRDETHRALADVLWECHEFDDALQRSNELAASLAPVTSASGSDFHTSNG